MALYWKLRVRLQKEPACAPPFSNDAVLAFLKIILPISVGQ